MTIPVTALHILRLMLQGEQNISGLQRDMRANAQAWLNAAQSGELGVAILAEYMSGAARSYQDRLAWITDLQTNAETWGKVVAMFATLGGAAVDFNAITTPLSIIAQQIASSDKSSPAAIMATCNAVLKAIPAPLSLWPE